VLQVKRRCINTKASGVGPAVRMDHGIEIRINIRLLHLQHSDVNSVEVGPRCDLCQELPRVVRLHSVFAQFFAQHGQMPAVSCFYRAKDMNRRNV